MLLGIFENYFVPLYEYTLAPETFEQKVHHSYTLDLYLPPLLSSSASST